MTIDGPFGCFNVPMQKLNASPEPQVGDILEVVYDGRIEELYPAQFPGIGSLKVYKPVEITGVITNFDQDALYFNPIEFSSLNDCIVTDWMEYIPTGTSFEVGDEIAITYNGNTVEDNPLILCGVVKIALTNEGFKKKYGDLISNTVDVTVKESNDGTDLVDGSNTILPEYVYTGKDPLEKAIIEYFQHNDKKKDELVWIPAFCIFQADAVEPFGWDAKKGDVKVYGNFWSFGYSKQGDTLLCKNGGEHPGVIYLKNNGGEDYEVTYFDAVGDGSKYAKDIKRICNGNKSLEKQYFNTTDAKIADVKNKRAWIIYNYVKDNSLDIKYYQDYGWDPVDFNMEVNSWSNVILESYD